MTERVAVAAAGVHGGALLVLDLLEPRMAICRLAADAPIPDWATRRAFFSISRTADELSVICAASEVPPEITMSAGWRALMVRGPLDMALTGILLALAAPLAAAGVSIMPVATYDTDYLLVRERQLPLAAKALRHAGHTVHGLPDDGGA